MITFARPTTDAAGQPAGLASNCAAVHAFCNVVNLEGSCLGRSTFNRGDVRLRAGLVRPERSRGIDDIRGQARPLSFARPPRRGDFEVRRKFQRLAGPHLEMRPNQGFRAFIAIRRPREFLRAAIRRVEHELFTVDDRVDRTHIRRNPIQNRRDRMHPRRIRRDRDLRRMRIHFDPCAHHVRTQIERARHDRRHDRQAKRRAMIRPRQVDRGRRCFCLRDIERVRARTRTNNRVPDLRSGRTRTFVGLLLPHTTGPKRSSPRGPRVP